VDTHPAFATSQIGKRVSALHFPFSPNFPQISLNSNLDKKSYILFFLLLDTPYHVVYNSLALFIEMDISSKKRPPEKAASKGRTSNERKKSTGKV